MEINSFKGLTKFGEPTKSGFFPELKTRVKKGEVRVRIIDQVSEFDQMRESWDQLVQMADASVYQSYAWQNSWWHNFAGNGQLYIIAFLDGDRLVGIAPFYIDSQKIFGLKKFKTLRFIGSNVPDNKGNGAFVNYSVSDFLDVIVHPDYEHEIAHALLQVMRYSSGLFNRTVLQETSKSSWVQRVLVPHLKKQNWNFEIEHDDVFPVLYLGNNNKSGAMDKFINERKSCIRTQIRQLNRIIDERKYFKINMIHTEAELEYYYPLLVEMHQKRWNDQGYPGSFQNLNYTRFLLDVFRSLLIEGRLWFVVVETSENAIAFNVSMLQGNKVYEIMKAYDHNSSYSKYRPANVAQFYMISHALQADYIEIHFLREMEKQKHELTGIEINNYVLNVDNTNSSRIKKALLWMHDVFQKYQGKMS